MKIFLTGGSGDVGTLLSRDLLSRGDTVANLDLAPPKIDGTQYIHGSILDPRALNEAMRGADCVIHIAAWHGIHEQTKTPQEFHDLNVTGTANVLQAAAEAGVSKFIFISSTSATDTAGIYGPTKIKGEHMCRDYAARYPDMAVIILRPRAFIPPWNRAVYPDFIAFANWFMRGAVHIGDFNKAILAALDLQSPSPAPIYTIDGAYDYSAADLADWHDQTMLQYYPEFENLMRRHNLDTAKKPKVLDIPPEQQLPGYEPQYTMRNLLQELARYGAEGPPAPYAQTPAKSKS